MDVGFWASRVNSVKSAEQDARLSSETYLYLYDSEGDDDVRPYFPCPFCYVDVELSTFCTHLREEHCFDVENAVCPVCAANIGRDVIDHFRIQHSHLLKKRWRSRRTGSWYTNGSVTGKELGELSSSVGVTSTINRQKRLDAAPDPMLSPFLCAASLLDSNQEVSSDVDAIGSVPSNAKSSGKSGSHEAEQSEEEARQRAEFVQDLLISTVF